MNWKWLFKWTENMICVVVIVFFGFLLYLMVQQERNGGETHSFGDYKLMIVMSGSMKPVFDTGALISVKKVDPAGIIAGDIITYRDGNNIERLITHRVVEVVYLENQTFFMTKGDNNDTKDFSLTPAENVVGKVAGSVPYIGFLARLSGLKMGVLVFLIIPMGLALFGEFKALGQIFRKKENCKIDK